MIATCPSCGYQTDNFLVLHGNVEFLEEKFDVKVHSYPDNIECSCGNKKMKVMPSSMSWVAESLSRPPVIGSLSKKQEVKIIFY